MNNQELKQKVDLLEERKEKLINNYLKLEANAPIEECKSFVEAIRECLPILGTARKERSTVRALLKLMDFIWRFSDWMPTYQPIVDSLNRFAAAHEDWQKVKAYAEEETETVDFELHGMAVMARGIVCKIEGKTFKIDSKLKAPPTSGQFIVYDDYHYRSAFGLTQGVHFFETVVLVGSDWGSNREFKIGWGTRRWNNGDRRRIDEENWLQCTFEIDDQHFIGFHDSYSSLPIGTVLGCLLDFPQRTFAFYVNGRKVMEKLTKECAFSSNPYYVQAKGPLLYFNFGQVPFKYPPPELATCPTADLASQINRYTLYKNVALIPLFDNQVEPIFTDAKQRKVTETLEQLVKEGEITKEKVEETYAQLWEEETFYRVTYSCRWVQAILEMENVDEGKVNEWAILVEAIFDFEDTRWLLFEYFLLPYIKLRVPEGDRSTRYRTMAILFAILLQYRVYSTNSIYSAPLYSFLFSAFLSTTDPITAMFTFIGLETVKKEKIEEGIIKELRSKEFTEKLKQWKVKIEKDKIEHTWKMTHSLAQLHLVIKHFEHSLESSSIPPPATTTPISLSPSKCSSQAKLSPDSLSLRSDFKWQSAGSHLSVDNSLSLAFPVFYFEATLLTSGKMRIGWATQRWQVESTKLGDSDLSFGYDGHTGCIWHQDVQWRVDKSVKKWQAGDVIGCLLDFTKKQFTFYQNGERIETNGDIYSRISKKIGFPFGKRILHVYEKNDTFKSLTPFISMHPYYAALSLSAYQQVTVNFGHTFFRFPPKCLDFWDFQQYSEYLKVHGPNKRVKSVHIPNATNAVINIESNSTTGNVSLNQNVVPSNPTTDEPPFFIKEPAVCEVCGVSSTVRLRTLKDCTHFAFCVACSAKEPLTCRKCPP